GLVFWPQIVAVDGLYWIARLAGGESSTLGLIVHLAISIVIGAGYGVLFERESPDWGAAVGWGMLYGITWWFVGTLTLFPIWLGASFTWTTAAAANALSSLLGHLIYGATTASVSCFWNAGIRIGCVSTQDLPRARRASSGQPARRRPRFGSSRSALGCCYRFC
ncbi:MAG: hypothetical protein H0U99_09605, partial [Chthoniobacterales bacterium]|nr:hypothetical protein [Chthoniobacterales bacterium]